MNHTEVLKTVIAAGALLRRGRIEFDWLELLETAVALLETDSNLDPVGLAEFYELHL
jgi:hypothetical protein